MAPKKPAPYEERKGTVGTKPGPLFNPPPAASAAPAGGSRPAPSTGGMFGGGGNAGKAAPSGGGKAFGGIAIPPAPVSGGKTRPGGGGGRTFGPDSGYRGTPEGPPDLGIPTPGGGIGPIPWNPSGPRTRNTPFGETVPGGEGDGGGDEFGAAMGYTPYNPPPAAFSAIQIMENVLFAATGIKGLGPWAAGLYNRGASPSEIVQALRYGTDTSEEGKAAYRAYLDAFPRMDEFMKQGIFAGSNPELQYIEYRNTVREAGARFNINDQLMTNTKIADYIAGRNSAAEIVNRMNMAATAIASTPADTISTLRDYYNLSSGDLMSFYLDTDQTEAMLQQRYAAAQIGTEALRQQVESDRAFSEQLAQRGVTTREAQEGFQKVAAQRAFEAGRGETATQREMAQAAFGDEELTKKVQRIGASRAGMFQGGGGFAQGTRTGLAGSSV